MSSASRRAALQSIARTPRSEGQVRQRLGKNGFTEEEIEDAVSYLLKYGYLNDEEFAQSVVRLARRKLKSALEIGQILQKYLIDRRLVQDLLRDEKQHERKKLEALFEKKYTQVESSRAIRALHRKGYPIDLVVSVVRASDV